jgi:hypothetical protein
MDEITYNDTGNEVTLIKRKVAEDVENDDGGENDDD